MGSRLQIKCILWYGTLNLQNPWTLTPGSATASAKDGRDAGFTGRLQVQIPGIL